MKANKTSLLNRPVFISASISIMVILLLSLIFQEASSEFFSSLQSNIVDNGSWFYVLVVAIILVFVVYLGFSRHGDIKLGPDHSMPDYSYVSWLSMLFAAGMGIGLMFYGVAEPLMHYLSPPTAQTGTVEAVKEAMKTTFFHWGLHAWAIYTIVALLLAYFSFRHDLPLTLRSSLFPLIGDKIYSWRGDLVDVFAVIGTLFGVATSLGIGVLQINAGLSYLFDVANTTQIQIILIISITCIAIVSVVSGLDKGIKILSETNIALAVALLLLVLLLGPTVFLLKALMQNTGAYLSDLVQNTFNLFAYQKTDWMGGWTIFYWGWWLAWAPFVGLFIARISRGRTIREFIMGVMIVPTVFTLIWMTIFGNSAIDMVFNQNNTDLGLLANENTPLALFLFLEQFPLSSVLSFIAVIMIVVFFVTSCDSGAMVVDMLCSHGNNQTPVWQRIYWTSSIGLIAGVLLLSDGLSALQTMTIASALPFTVILLLAIVGLIKALRVEAFKQHSLQFTQSPVVAYDNDAWKERLHSIVDFPSRERVIKFIKTTGISAFRDIKEELSKSDIHAQIDEYDTSIKIIIGQGDNPTFVYELKTQKHLQPEFVNEQHEFLTTNGLIENSSTISTASDSSNISSKDDLHYYRAEVHLSEGGKDYCVMGWSKTAVINDVVDQYHKHLYFLHLAR